jgi:transcriptional regulator with XRE-family HTH domain
MPTKIRAADEGTRIGLALLKEIGRTVRDARISAALSQEELGRQVGLSRAAVARYESGTYRPVTVLDSARLLRILGLELRLGAYPVGTSMRDAGHAKLVGRLLAHCNPPLVYAADVPLPNPGDMRAWDILLKLDGRRVAIEAETRLHDLQELVRRLLTKRRDGRVDGLVLAAADTRHNRLVLPALLPLLPDYLRLSRARFIHLLEDGQLPPDGIVLF